MKYGQIRIGNEAFQQVNKTKAERLFNEGMEVFLLPCNANPNSVWISLCPVKKDDKSFYSVVESFNSVVNGYRYYNCNRKLGLYVVYFIKID